MRKCVVSGDKPKSADDSEARKAAIFDSAMDSIISIDHAGKIIDFNPQAERTFGYKRDDVIGQPMDELIIPPALRSGIARLSPATWPRAAVPSSAIGSN